MNRQISDFLPDVFPFGNIEKTESITYKTYDDGDGGFIPETEYELSKAPVNSVAEVVATVDGERKTLVRDVDWDVVNDEKVVFLDGERPDPETTFTVRYYAESILSRYLKSVEETTEAVDDDIGVNKPISDDDNTVVSSKYISTAKDNELDEIGKLFGPLGQRAGRSRERYRTYLKSIAKVYNGRGTKDSLADAVSTIVSSDDVTIERDQISFREDFVNNEYAILFDEFESHRVSLLYDISEIADPSGVKFIGPVYNGGVDSTTAIEGPKIDIDDYEQYDSQLSVPADFIDPIGPNESILDVADIFGEDVTNEIILPREFEWAHQIVQNSEQSSGGDWSEFQWGEESWSSQTEADVEIVGPEWEFADWNYIESQGTFTTRDGPIFIERVESTLSDVSPFDSTFTSDTLEPVSVSFEKQEEISFAETTSSEIEDTRNEEPSLIDSQVSEIIDTTVESSGTNDLATVQQNVAQANTSLSNDSVAFDVSTFGWNDTWGEMFWAPTDA